MKKILLSLLSLFMAIPSIMMNVNAIEDNRAIRYDSWRYRYETESGYYSYGEEHPSALDLPEKYDSRDYGWVTSMKNQGNTGICWSFGLNGAMEVNINKKGLNQTGKETDLSEAHTAYFHFSQLPNELNLNPEDALVPDHDYVFLDMGGSALLASLTVSKGIGPVSESVAPFKPYDYTFVEDIKKDSRYQRDYYLKDAAHPMMDDTQAIKAYVYKHGSAAIAYRASSTDKYDEYVHTGGFSNHIVHIVGYDDTIPKESFTPAAQMDGAWIIKNSWGNTSNGGYLYLSYDSTSLELTVPNVVHKDVYDYMYFYEASANFEENYSYVGKPVTLANIYEGLKDEEGKKELLHSVGLTLAGNNTEYELQIYLDPKEGEPESGTAVFDQPIIGRKTHRGYYTINLPKSIEIDLGQKFSIVVRLQNRNLNYVTPYYLFKGEEFSQYKVIEQTMPNQSFRQLDEKTWEDLHDIERTVSIRALTNVVDDNYKAIKQLKSSDFSIEQNEYHFTNEAIEPVIEVKNKELLEMMDYGIHYENNIDVGKGKVIILGMNDYEGSKIEIPFTINKALLKEEFLEDIALQYQTGKQITPEVIMYDYDLLLVEGEDYIVSYGENLEDQNTTNEGTVTLTGIGDYEGEVTKTFDIVNPIKKLTITTEVVPYNAGVAVTKSDPLIGEEIKLVAGYYDGGTAFVRWLINGIDFGKEDEMYLIAYDDMHIVASYAEEKTVNDFVNTYNELMNVQRNGANDYRWNQFNKQLKYMSDIIDNNVQDVKKMTRSIIYLQDAYKMLYEPIDTTQALLAVEESKNINKDDYDLKSWGTLQYRLEILKHALDDVNITQDKLNQVLNEYNIAKNSKTNQDTNKIQLQTLYNHLLTINQDLYTLSSIELLNEKLNKAKTILDKTNSSIDEINEAYNELNAVILVERGQGDLLISLINECLLINKDQYTKDSYESLSEVLQEAILVKNSINDCSQKDIDEIYNKLNTAKNNLISIVVNKQQLISLYNSYKSINKEDYTIESYNRFKEALDHALSIIEEDNLKQEDVDQAYNQLLTAINQLDKENKVNKDELLQLLAKAKSIDTTNKTKESVSILNTTIHSIEQLLLKDNLTSEEVNQSIIGLNRAIEGLEDQIIMSFPDVHEDSWYYTSVKKAFELGLMKGVGDGTYFKPTVPLSRAMAATILYRIEGEPKVVFKPVLSDVHKYDWYKDGIVWAYENKVINGYKSGKFGANDNIKREDLCVMIYNYALKKGMNKTKDIDFSSFEDGHLVDHYAKEAVMWCIENKIISGSIRNNKYYINPLGHTNRAEAAKMFSIFDQLLKD